MSTLRLQDTKNSNNNKGFAFIDYYNQACAEYSRQKMTNPKFNLENNTPTVSWADPKNSDSSAASQVCKNLVLLYFGLLTLLFIFDRGQQWCYISIFNDQRFSSVWMLVWIVGFLRQIITYILWRGCSCIYRLM